MGKRLLAVFLAAVMAVGLAACGSSGSSSESTGAAATGGEKELKVQIGPNPETIDPALNSAVDGGNMLLHAFECLLTVDQEGALQPGAAEKWETSEDGLKWTFHLRDGLKWSDGSDLTAEDFVYSWKRVCDPAVAAPYAETVLGMVKGYDKAIEGDLDALTVEQLRVFLGGFGKCGSGEQHGHGEQDSENLFHWRSLLAFSGGCSHQWNNYNT